MCVGLGGHFSNFEHNFFRTCIECSPGNFEFMGVCHVCPLGSRSQKGAYRCLCDDGKSIITNPLEVCPRILNTPCERNYRYVDVTETCTCDVNAFFNTSSQKCQPCLNGEISNHFGRAPCRSFA